MTESHVLTCAHVVSDALDKPRQEMSTGPVLLDFPFVKAGEKVTAVLDALSLSPTKRLYWLVA